MRAPILTLALAGALAGGVATPALAAPSAADAIAFCARIPKKDARIECFDQVARDIRSGQLTDQPATATDSFAPAPRGAAAAPLPQGAPTPLTPPQTAYVPGAGQPGGFGGEKIRRSDDERDEADQGPNRIEIEAVASTDNGLGQWRMSFADGTIWAMTERVALFRPPAPKETVTIRKGSLGSYLMEVGKQASVRVTRVR